LIPWPLGPAPRRHGVTAWDRAAAAGRAARDALGHAGPANAVQQR